MENCRGRITEVTFFLKPGLVYAVYSRSWGHGDIQQGQRANASIARELVDTFAPLALNTMMMVFYLVVMLRYSPVLTLVGIVSILLNLLVSRIISKKRINITRVRMRDAGKLAGTTVAGIIADTVPEELAGDDGLNLYCQETVMELTT